MSKVNLLPNEAIIMRDTAIKHDRGGLQLNTQSDELVLTNQALIVVHKNPWGFTKNTQRFSLDQIKVVNGDPQVVSGKAQDGTRQLHVYFSHGIEAFSLGEADEDAEAGILETLFTPQREKEARNLREWQEAISCAVLALPQHAQSTGSYSVNPDTGKPLAPPVPGTQVPSTPIHVTKKCIGCMAPLSGPQGQKTVCKYCDTEQAL